MYDQEDSLKGDFLKTFFYLLFRMSLYVCNFKIHLGLLGDPINEATRQKMSVSLIKVIYCLPVYFFFCDGEFNFAQGAVFGVFAWFSTKCNFN